MKLELITRKPDSTLKSKPILFVHGMWHGAWCWEENFLPYFARHGYEAYAVSLRGHGNSEGPKSLRWIRIADYVSDVEQVVKQLGAEPILVGHSMGGIVVQKYLENHEAPAAVLLAPAPANGVLPTALRIFRRRPWAFLKANLSMRMYPVVETLELAREAFFSADMPQEQLQRHFRRLQNDSYMAFIDMLILNLPKTKRVTTPILVVGAENDTIFSIRQHQSTARAYNTQAEIIPNIAHDMMLEANWQVVADKILAWLID